MYICCRNGLRMLLKLWIVNLMIVRRPRTMSTVFYNDDVLIEILLWLPAKSLTRFKSVCKHWQSLISTDRFCLLHTLRRPKLQPSLILNVQYTSHLFYFHPILNPHKLIPYTFTIPNPKIWSSCNGLLLLQSDVPEKSYYVCNPTTKKSRKITLTESDKYTNLLGLNLAFDPLVSPHYKIVCVRAATERPDGGGRCCQIEVYDSASSTWKLHHELFTASINAKFSSGVHWKNVIHWENFPSSHLYFDTDKNCIANLPRPVIPWRSGGSGGTASSCQLQESNGRLYHFIVVSHLGDKSIAVYELQDDYSEWLLKYHDGFGRLPGRFRILSFVRGDDGETSTLVTHVPGKITAYRFVDKSSEELIDLTNQPFYREDSVQFDSRNVHQFGESLAPV